MAVKVILQDDLKDPTTPTVQFFQTWLNTTLQQIPNRIPNNIQEVCIRIVNKTESATLNKTFRHKSGPTNVLSFPNENENCEEENSLGDIAICSELVASEATEGKIPLTNHWAHLTVHGILHLLGYDHIENKEAEIMESLEIQILKLLNIENPYEERDDEN